MAEPALSTPVDRTAFAASLARVPYTRIRELGELALSMDGVLRLYFGESNLPTPAFIVEAAAQALRDGHTFYSENAGLPTLRSRDRSPVRAAARRRSRPGLGGGGHGLGRPRAAPRGPLGRRPRGRGGHPLPRLAERRLDRRPLPRAAGRRAARPRRRALPARLRRPRGGSDAAHAPGRAHLAVEPARVGRATSTSSAGCSSSAASEASGFSPTRSTSASTTEARSSASPRPRSSASASGPTPSTSCSRSRRPTA